MRSLFGADVSHWNETTPIRGLSFIIIKASEGRTSDPAYGTHVGRAAAAGLYIAAYHWARRDVDIDKQALYFVQHAAGAKALAVDVEPTVRKGVVIVDKMTRTETRALIAAVKRHDSLHRPVLLYMSESVFYYSVGQDFNWVANWSHSPAVYDIHQYDSTPYDQNVAKDQATLDRLFGVVTKPPGHVIHIAHGATVVTVRLGTTGTPRCIASVGGEYGVPHYWAGKNSKASCGAPVVRRTCDGKSHATTVPVLSGVYKGQHVRIDPPNVTVS